MLQRIRAIVQILRGNGIVISKNADHVDVMVGSNVSQECLKSSLMVTLRTIIQTN